MAFVPAGLAIAGVLLCRRWMRVQQISQQPLPVQAAWERWDRVRRLVRLHKNQELHKHVPAPVLSALELTARAWHEARDDLRSMAIHDATFAMEIQDEVDAVMMSAVAMAAPVVTRDDQGTRHRRQIEADTKLMSQVCQRIGRETARLERWGADAAALGGVPESNLRQRLELSQKERAVAEAELTGDLLQP
jgi:hypothetical protein